MVRTWGVALAAVLALAGGRGVLAGAAAPEDDKPLSLPLEAEITNPDWRKMPTGDDLAREYPPLASMMNIEGKATITCTVEVEGRLDQCRVLSESPAGFGFGAATMRMAAYFEMIPARVDGQPVKGVVTVPIAFRLGGAKPNDDQIAPPAPTSPAALDLAREVLRESEPDPKQRPAVHVDRPHAPAMRRPVPELVQDRPVAQGGQHLFGVGERDLVFELGAAEAVARPLHRHPGPALAPAHPHLAVAEPGDQPVAQALATDHPLAPGLAGHEELPLDLRRHP